MSNEVLAVSYLINRYEQAVIPQIGFLFCRFLPLSMPVDNQNNGYRP